MSRSRLTAVIVDKFDQIITRFNLQLAQHEHPHVFDNELVIFRGSTFALKFVVDRGSLACSIGPRDTPTTWADYLDAQWYDLEIALRYLGLKSALPNAITAEFGSDAYKALLLESYAKKLSEVSVDSLETFDPANFQRSKSSLEKYIKRHSS